MGIHRNLYAALVAAAFAIAGCKGSDGVAGLPGTNGSKALVTTTAEAAGANCGGGGVKVESGLDANGNNILDASEVVATRYVCNGSNGTAGTPGTNGATGLVATTVEPAGANCTQGGIKVEVGLDANANGTLDAAEVTGTRYICNGAAGNNGTNGLTALVATATLQLGDANCATGGTSVSAGVDTNGNGTLDPSEVTSTQYVCNGATGAAGNNGQNTLVATAAEPAGVNCATGGVRLQFGLDANGNGTLDPSEVNASLTTYACNGAGGQVGAAGLPGISAATSGLSVTVVSVSTTSPIAVRVKLADDRGYPVDFQGKYSLNQTISLRFALAYVTTSTVGTPPVTVVNPYTVLTTSGTPAQPTTVTAALGTNLLENGTGAGDYTFTFPAAVTYDPAHAADTYTLWIQASRQVDTSTTSNGALSTDPRTFTAVNVGCDYVPASAPAPFVCNAAGTLKREIVQTANCSACHRGFKAEVSTANGFHGAARVDARFCDVCHNPGRVSNPAANSMVFVHRIHNSANLQPANVFHAIMVEYPQDIRNCDGCHKNALQGAQSFANPTRAACGSCHDYTSFTDIALPSCTNPVTKDAVTGLPVPCLHIGDVQADDTACTTCHNPTGLARNHRPIAPPDPNNSLNCVGTPAVCGSNANTNAAYLAGAGVVPPGAIKTTWEVSWVDTVAVAGGVQPIIRFRALQDGVAVPLQTYAAGVTTELFANFIGSPSAYFVYSVPQDGVATPADYNGSASAYIKNVWNGSATKTTGIQTSGLQGGAFCSQAAPCTCTVASPCQTTGAGILTGPDASNYYTLQLTGVIIPATATQLTGGIGYTYSLTSTVPLTQTNVAGYLYSATTKQGGLILPAPNVYKVASGYLGRRILVDTAKCQTCHAPLGVSPTFHAGQRNDGPSCSWCHNPNRTSSGWDANAKGFIHAIHAARVRTNNFVWHATAPGVGYGEVEFPGPLNNCTACHIPGAQDFNAPAVTQTSGTATSGVKGTTVCTVAAPCTCGTGSNACTLTFTSQQQVANLLHDTVAQGRYNGDPLTNPTGWYSLSPFVVTDNVTNYGLGFSTSERTVTLPDGRTGSTQDAGATVCTDGVPCFCGTTAASGAFSPCVYTGSVTSGTMATTAATPTICTVVAPCTTCQTTKTATAGPCTQALQFCSPGAPCEAEPTTLVSSPVTAACSACHDSPMQTAHMKAMGGKFYQTRAITFAPTTPVEQCMICHGPGTIASLFELHK